MTDSASETITIAAPAARVWEIIADIERYPEWVDDVTEARVVERDADGRPVDVEFRASALGRSTHYTLRYDYADAPNALRWTMLSGDIQRSIDGAYILNGAGDSTEVRYDLAIELVVPLPGFVKRRAERRILNAVHQLRIVAES
ncbi:MAG: SRPBCC family protein [Ilumatobacteraceae bacterium]|jgi:uncharacterized protein YndB with AHSA1/START domain|nr:cyclase [Actinomycetota bacterium]